MKTTALRDTITETIDSTENTEKGISPTLETARVRRLATQPQKSSRKHSVVENANVQASNNQQQVLTLSSFVNRITRFLHTINSHLSIPGQRDIDQLHLQVLNHALDKTELEKTYTSAKKKQINRFSPNSH